YPTPIPLPIQINSYQSAHFVQINFYEIGHSTGEAGAIAVIRPKVYGANPSRPSVFLCERVGRNKGKGKNE
ncbi:hypothetical protein, partial [Schinkia azotoformans]|uniref:hypothetical protein n=1 Tax=Schinkia azotoformans TaxID=1454 RepID=UPI002DB85B65